MKEKSDHSQHTLPDAVKDNIDTVADFFAREESKISKTQSVIEIISAIFGSPIYFSSLISFVGIWIVINLSAASFGISQFDKIPFFMLQGIVGLNGVLITIAVLVRQNRLEHLEEKRAHLILHATLLAEKKTTKIIQLLEELRLDLPNVKNRLDPEIEKMKIETDPQAILDSIDTQKK